MEHVIIKDRITKVMQNQGITQKQLAELTGITRPSINRVINGRRCRAKTLDSISRALDIFPLYLVGQSNTAAKYTEYTTIDGVPVYTTNNDE